jgi:hypothetical protein
MKATLHTVVPWWAKIAAKIAIARMPVSMKAWHRLGLFVPGSMRDPDYAILVFELHWQRAGCPGPGFTYLELGPGESLATAIVAWAYGADGGALVDADDFAMRDIAAYRVLIERLSQKNTVRDISPLRDCASFDALLKAVNAQVLTDGVKSLDTLATGSVDLIFSQAVLEHVPLSEFGALATALHRIQTPDGVGSHHVDFKDHLQGSLNNLRFSERLWEKPWFAKHSGFYTNRLRFSAMMAAFEGAGFSVAVPERSRWTEAPLPRSAFSPSFRGLSDDDLLTSGAVFVLTKRPG